MVAMDRAFPYDAQTSNEADWRALFAEHDGVVAGHLDELEVFADSTGQQVKVRTGSIWAGGQRGFIDAQKTVPLTANVSGNPRYDLIVARNDFDSNDFEVVAVAGTPAASPTVPSLTSDATQAERALAVVGPLSNGYATVAGSAVQDRRGFWTPSGRQYARPAARTQWRPSPHVGERAYMRDTSLEFIYSGTVWSLASAFSNVYPFSGPIDYYNITSTTGITTFSSLRLVAPAKLYVTVIISGITYGYPTSNTSYWRMVTPTGAAMMNDKFMSQPQNVIESFSIMGSAVFNAGDVVGFDLVNWVDAGLHTFQSHFKMLAQPVLNPMAATDVLVAGNGDVYVANAADVATVPGSALVALDPAFRKLGLLTPSGAVWNPTITTRSFRPWGSLQPTKRRTTGRDGTVTFELLEFVEDVLLTALVGGGYLETSTTTSIYLPSIENDPPMLTVVIDNIDEQADGIRVKRLLFPAAQVVSSPEIAFSNEQATSFPVMLACNASPATLFPYAIMHGFVPAPPRPPRPNIHMRAYVLLGEGPPGSDADAVGHAGAVYIDIVSGDVYEGVSGFVTAPTVGRRYMRLVHGPPDDDFGTVGDVVWDIDSSVRTVYGKQ